MRMVWARDLREWLFAAAAGYGAARDETRCDEDEGLYRYHLAELDGYPYIRLTPEPDLEEVTRMPSRWRRIWRRIRRTFFAV